MSEEATKKIPPDMARAGFQPGLYRNREGGLHLATGVVPGPAEHMVLHRDLTLGETRVDYLYHPTEDAWTDQVWWPKATEAEASWAALGTGSWPYGHRAPRYVACPPFRYLIAVMGHDLEARDQVIAAAREFQQVEVAGLDFNVRATLAALEQYTAIAAVVPLLAISAERGVNPRDQLAQYTVIAGVVGVTVGPDKAFTLGQLQGILAVLGTEATP